MPLTQLVPSRGVFYSVLSTFFIVSIILAFTSVGFPYSDDQDAPRLQRFRVIHAKRTLHDPNGQVLFTDGNILMHAWDRNSIRTLENTFGSQRIVAWRNEAPTCDQFNCGFPHYSLNRAVLLSNFNEPNLMQPTAFNLLRVERIDTRVEIEFTVALKTLTHLSITPTNGMTFNTNETSLHVREFLQDGRAHYLSRIAIGSQLNTPVRALVVLDVSFSFKTLKLKLN